MLEVGQHSKNYRCESCPAHVRGQRRCPEPGNREGALELEEARRRAEAPPADPAHPDACPVLRLGQTPRVGLLLDWAPHWREQGQGPGGAGLSHQPQWFVAGQREIAAHMEELRKAERERADADKRAAQAGLGR